MYKNIKINQNPRKLASYRYQSRESKQTLMQISIPKSEGLDARRRSGFFSLKLTGLIA